MKNPRQTHGLRNVSSGSRGVKCEEVLVNRQNQSSSIAGHFSGPDAYFCCGRQEEIDSFIQI